MAALAVFEDHHWRNFAPLTLTRPTFDIKVGAKTYLEEYGQPPDYLIAREYLAEVTQQNHKASLVNPTAVDGDAIFINGLLHPGSIDLAKLAGASHTFTITSGQRLMVARLGKKDSEYLSECSAGGKKINVRRLSVEKATDLELENAQGILSYPWEIIKNLENSLSMQTAFSGTDKMEIPAGVRTLGTGRIVIEKGSTVEEGTVLDARSGGIFIGSGSYIAPSRIAGPTFIDGMTQVKQFTIIENSYIGFNCRIAGEVEDSIVSSFTNKAHAGFLGHSYVGEWVNLGAMTTTSDLKMTYGDIKMDDGTGRNIETGTNKIGSFIGDMCKTSIGTLVYGGRRIGVSAHLHGLITSDVPGFTIYGSSIGSTNVELELKSAVQTQRRMMTRRGVVMSKGYEKMIEEVFTLTSPERRKSKVRRGKFSI